MSEFSSNIAHFFRSEAPTFSEFKTLIKESAVQEDWLNAVSLYRKGIFALQKNDFEGLEIIKQANDALQKVLATSKETVKANMQALNESINSFKKGSPEDLQLVKFNFGMLYESCKSEGMKGILKEETFYEEFENADAKKENDANQHKITEETPTEDSVKVMDEFGSKNPPNVTPGPVQPSQPSTKVPAATGSPSGAPVVEDAPQVTSNPVTPTANTATASPTPAPAATPASTPTATPAPQTIAEQKASGYRDGFEAGRKYYQNETKGEPKFGIVFKDTLKEVVETQLYEKPYNYVQNYQTGFKSGCAMEEEVLKELHQEAYNKFEEDRAK